MLKPPNLFRTILVNGRNAFSFRGSTGTLSPQRSLESHPQVEDLKVHPLGYAQAERVSLAVARDNSGYRSGGACLGSDALHNLME
jgi:hypothetical protein